MDTQIIKSRRQAKAWTQAILATNGTYHEYYGVNDICEPELLTQAKEIQKMFQAEEIELTITEADCLAKLNTQLDEARGPSFFDNPLEALNWIANAAKQGNYHEMGILLNKCVFNLHQFSPSEDFKGFDWQKYLKITFGIWVMEGNVEPTKDWETLEVAEKLNILSELIDAFSQIASMGYIPPSQVNGHFEGLYEDSIYCSSAFFWPNKTTNSISVNPLFGSITPPIGQLDMLSDVIGMLTALKESTERQKVE